MKIKLKMTKEKTKRKREQDTKSDRKKANKNTSSESTCALTDSPAINDISNDIKMRKIIIKDLIGDPTIENIEFLKELIELMKSRG